MAGNIFPVGRIEAFMFHATEGVLAFRFGIEPSDGRVYC